MTKVAVDNLEQMFEVGRVWEAEMLVKWNCSPDEMKAMLRAIRTKPDIFYTCIECMEDGTNPIDLLGFRIPEGSDPDNLWYVDGKLVTLPSNEA